MSRHKIKKKEEEETSNVESELSDVESQNGRRLRYGILCTEY